MLKLPDIRTIQVELTTRCNARCPMCMRNYRGMDYNSGYPLCELSLQDFQKIVSPEILTQLISPDAPVNGRIPTYYGFRGISFNGNLGDFSLAHDALDIVQYIVKHRVPVQINTNGSTRNPDWWRRLALPGVSVGFALDGMWDTHSLYRQDTDWYKIIENAKAFIAAGGRAVWRFVPFDHNRHQESQCKELAQSLGFSRFENIYDGRDTGPVYSRDGVFSHYIGHPPPGNTVPHIHDLLQNHITWYDKNTYQSSKDTADIVIDCVHKKTHEIYIAADGSVYPCCFLGFYPGQMQHPGNSELALLIKENNALKWPLEHCLSWFDQIEQAWQHTSIAQGRPYQCVQSCGRKGN